MCRVPGESIGRSFPGYRRRQILCSRTQHSALRRQTKPMHGTVQVTSAVCQELSVIIWRVRPVPAHGEWASQFVPIAGRCQSQWKRALGHTGGVRRTGIWFQHGPAPSYQYGIACGAAAQKGRNQLHHAEELRPQHSRVQPDDAARSDPCTQEPMARCTGGRLQICQTHGLARFLMRKLGLERLHLLREPFIALGLRQLESGVRDAPDPQGGKGHNANRERPAAREFQRVDESWCTPE